MEISYGQISYLGAGDSVPNVEVARLQWLKGAFSVNQKQHLNLGIAKDNYWVNFTVINQSRETADLILNLENPRLNEIEITTFKKQQPVYYLHTGDYLPFAQRDIMHNQFAIPQKFEPGDTISYFLFLKHKGNTLQVPVTLYTTNAFFEIIEQSYLIVGITIGFLMLTFFFSSFLFLNSYSKVFAYYSLYVLSISMWLLSTEGYGFQFLWPRHPEWATRFGPGFSVFNLTTFLAIALEFTKPYDQTIWVRNILRGIVGFTFLWGAFAFMPFISIKSTYTMSFFLSISFAVYFLSLILVMAYLLYVSIRKNKVVIYYLLAVIISILFTFLTVAKHSGLINLPFSSGIFMSIGIVIELILMSLGISKQLYHYKKEKEEALLMVVQQEKEMNLAILSAQENERKRISRELHDDIGAGLTQISLISEAAVGKPHPQPELTDITDTTRKLVNSMGDIIWSMTPGHESLDFFNAYLREQIHQLLEYSGKEYQIRLPDNNEGILLNNVQRRNLLLVVKEMVHNAVKYSNAKHITVTAELLNKQLSFEVKDDGIGFDQEKGLKGNGLRNIKSRINELNGSFIIESKYGNGTKFSFLVPL